MEASLHHSCITTLYTEKSYLCFFPNAFSALLPRFQWLDHTVFPPCSPLRFEWLDHGKWVFQQGPGLRGGSGDQIWGCRKDTLPKGTLVWFFLPVFCLLFLGSWWCLSSFMLFIVGVFCWIVILTLCLVDLLLVFFFLLGGLLMGVLVCC